jgi:uncharacterized protein (TIGR03435 family)
MRPLGNFVSLLQRAILDRPVVDKTGLTGRYDFDLEWAPDETQFSGGLTAGLLSLLGALRFLRLSSSLA